MKAQFQVLLLGLMLGTNGASHAAPSAPRASNPIAEECRRYGASLDPADPAVMILPIPASYVGMRPAKPVTYQRKVPITIASWTLSYCEDDGDTFHVVYEPAPAAPAAFASCEASLILFPRNARMGEAISGGEATIRTMGLSGAVRSRTQLSMVSGQPATYYRVSGIRVFTGTPAKQVSQITFGTVRSGSGAGSNPEGTEPITWTFSAGTKAAMGPACAAVHMSMTDLARQFPLGASDKAWVDALPQRLLSNLNLPPAAQ